MILTIHHDRTHRIEPVKKKRKGEEEGGEGGGGGGGGGEFNNSVIDFLSIKFLNHKFLGDLP